MNLEYLPPNQIIWDENERTGKRHVDLINTDNGVKLIAIISHRNKAEWEARIIPMGYSFSDDDVRSLWPELSGFVLELMKYLETNTEITYEDILSFIGLE